VGKQKPLTKGKAAFLLVVSALGAMFSVLVLHGWYVYLGLAGVGAVIVIGFLQWNRKRPNDEFPKTIGNGRVM
jgi:O-antigen ligase